MPSVHLSVCPLIVCLLTASCGFLRLRSWDPCSDHQVLGYQRQAAELRVSVLEVSGGLLGLGARGTISGHLENVVL